MPENVHSGKRRTCHLACVSHMFTHFFNGDSLAAAHQVFAWDTDRNGVREDEDDGRSYISAVSEMILDDNESCDGRAKSNMGEARMDIEDSEMGYLGFHDGESYGLTWKVGRGGIIFV